MSFKKFLPIFLVMVLHIAIVSAKENLTLKAKRGEFTIDPETLSILYRSDTSSILNLTTKAIVFDKVSDLKIDNKSAQWYYPHLKIEVNVRVDEHGLKFSFKTNKEQIFQWPMAGLTPSAKALILPDGEGLYIPNNDSFWRKEFKKFPSLSLSIPFWAIEYANGNYVSYIWDDSDVDTDVQVHEKQAKLYVMNEHQFLKRSQFPEYTVFIHLAGDSPISPAIDYRNLLINQNKFVSLKQKILENANVNKLLGAFHIWVWGDGKALSMLDQLEQCGIKHALINYERSPSSVKMPFNIEKNYINSAESRGYLIGPSVRFDSAQDSKNSLSISSVLLNHLRPEACIRNFNGTILTGFENQGCYLSSEALRLREPREKNIEKQIDNVLEKGGNAIYLSSDAAYPLYNDYSRHHPMTRDQDLNNRLERMRFICSDEKVVLGSETGLSWANSIIAYNNGAFLTFPEIFWFVSQDKKHFGAWRSQDNTPTILFQIYNASSEFLRAVYNPRYRLPLYEAVFHDAVISTDRLELNELKIPAARKVKMLLQSLYNVPPIWALNEETLQKNKKYFMDYYNFFSPLHQMAGIEPLTLFEWLTEDHLVQQTQFGNRLTLTANFSDRIYENIEPYCIRSEWKEDGSGSLFCLKN